MHRVLPTLAALVVIALVAGACSGSAASGSDVAASVDGNEIPVAEVEEEVSSRAESTDLASELAGDESGDLRDTLRTNVLTELIRSEIVRLAAEDQDVEVTDADIAEQRETVVESVGGEEQFEQILADSNVSDEQLRQTLRDQAIQAKIGEQLADDVTDDEVRQAFDEDPQGQFGEQVEVRHILTETEQEAQEAIERIESGEEFADVAQEVSIDPGSAENGGDLGQIGRGATVPEFEEAAFDAEVGELVGPVESQFGFHVIEVTDRIAGQDFADASDEIRTQLEDTAAAQAFNTFITEFVEGLDVEVDEQFGVWDPTTVSVVAEPPPEAGTEAPVPVPSDLPVPSEPAPDAAPSE